MTCSFALVLLASACGPSELGEGVENSGPLSGDFAVSDHFTASGFMGDGEESGFLTVQRDESCPMRPRGAEGSCFEFRYVPGEKRWAGVYFQYPANNWGSQPGRAIDGGYSRVRFSASARYTLLLPSGNAIGGACAMASDCRPGLSCEVGACAPAHTTALGERCLVSAECAGEAQCVAQVCTEAGTSESGNACGTGDDGSCGAGMRCAELEGEFRCAPEGALDVGGACASRNDCQAGLYCADGTCQPKTELGPVRFMVGGIQPTKAGLEYADQIGAEYFPLGTQPLPMLSPDVRRFELDLTGQEFDSLIGGFMWATAFPDIDVTRATGPAPYLADPTEPMFLYLDDVVFEAADAEAGAP
jgi:hypothetical protein